MMHSGTNWLLAAILAVGLAAAPVGLAPVGLAPAHAAGDDDDAPVARPKNPDYTRAVARIKAGDYAGALASLQKVVAAEPDNADVHNYLGYSYRNLGRYDKSLASYRRALAIKPGHRGALEYLGELYLKTGELAKAQAQLDKLDNACFFGCAEFRELKAKIANYRKRAASG